MKIRESVKIADLVTMRLGGEARYVVEIEDMGDVKKAYRFAEERDLPTFVLGGGANTIGRDEGFDGVIILNRLKGIELETTGDRDEYLLLSAMGGEVWDDVVAVACDRGYTGIEALSAIPGTAGAAPVQNIGAYGQEVGQTLISVEAYDKREGKFVTLPAEDLELGYRRSIFNTGAEIGRYLIVKSLLRLQHGEMSGKLYNSLQEYLDRNNIHNRSPSTIRKAVTAVRDSKLPRPETKASSGSFFKNVYVNESETKRLTELGVPVRIIRNDIAYGKVNTGWLIESCGLKGKALHGMRINQNAALVLMNESAKSYKDLAAARDEIIKTVWEKYGIKLEQEPVEI